MDEVYLAIREKTFLKSCLNFFEVLEDTARYAGLLLAPAEGFGLRPKLFLRFGQKKSVFYCFGPFLAFFCSPVITLVTFSSNISNNNKKTTKCKKIQKIQKK